MKFVWLVAMALVSHQAEIHAADAVDVSIPQDISAINRGASRTAAAGSGPASSPNAAHASVSPVTSTNTPASSPAAVPHIVSPHGSNGSVSPIDTKRARFDEKAGQSSPRKARSLHVDTGIARQQAASTTAAAADPKQLRPAAAPDDTRHVESKATSAGAQERDAEFLQLVHGLRDRNYILANGPFAPPSDAELAAAASSNTSGQGVHESMDSLHSASPLRVFGSVVFGFGTAHDVKSESFFRKRDLVHFTSCIGQVGVQLRMNRECCLSARAGCCWH